MASVWCILSITEIDMTRHIQRSVEREKDDDYMLYHHRQTRNAAEGGKNQENQTYIT